ncbi:GGDEF domain-containing protein [Thalassotalea euphylliae]|uniref:diguanylate cyclase n=1 Tax=Thalassotalea euphylliae TaxID=1655234 RepID=A0A3E0TUN3_9GAMM|nr:diguanylate cyclase [Thalassotalea euphylliae]REL28381.1 GGDEF domain-containing protein [Thalassotalea euphylliae]
MRFFFFIFSVFLTFTPVAAADIDEQLATIQQLERTQQLAELKQLLGQSSLTPIQRFSVLEAVTWHYFQHNELDASLEQGQIAQQYAKQYRLADKQASANKLIGIIYYYQGNLKQALASYQLALAYFEKTAQKIEQANVLNNIALAQSAMGRSQAALTSYLAAEPLYLAHGSEYDAIDVRANIAGLYIALRRFDQAIAMLESAVTYYQANNHQQDLARAQADLGVAHKYAGNLQQAQSRLLASLTFYQQQEDSYNLAATLHNIAEVYLLMKLPIKAQAYAEQGEMRSRDSEHSKALIGNLQVLAKVWYWREDALRAQQHLREAMNLAKKLDYQTSMASLQILNALVEAALGRPEQAIAAAQAYQSLERNRFNTELNAMLAETEALQLQQKFDILQQQTAYQAQLSHSQTVKERYFFAAATLFMLVLFLGYRKLRDFHLHKELALQVELQTEKLTKANQQLLQASLQDGLTGVQNRRSFDADIRKLWQGVTQTNQSFALLFIDIDHFKAFNDTYGHVTGDNILKAVAQVLEQSVTHNATVYRYGGGEFAILLEHSSKTQLIELFERIQAKLNTMASVAMQETITVSAGACYSDEYLGSLNEMLKRADSRLYQAKDAGRNQLVA